MVLLRNHLRPLLEKQLKHTRPKLHPYRRIFGGTKEQTAVVDVRKVPHSLTEPFPVFRFIFLVEIVFATHHHHVQRTHHHRLAVLVTAVLLLPFLQPALKFLTQQINTYCIPIFSCREFYTYFLRMDSHSTMSSIMLEGLERSTQIATVTLAKLSFVKREGIISL
jgi:hypothetical protein